MSKMMRIDEDLDREIKDLMKISGLKRREVLQRALDKLKREYFVLKANEEIIEFMKKNKKDYEEYKKELEVWDITSKDGLEDYEDDAYGKKSKINKR